MGMLEYVLFVISFFYASFWAQIRLFVSSIRNKRFPVIIIQDTKIKDLLDEKTGINIGCVKILESSRLFGMMVGIPSRPQLILSRNLYNTFNADEMEYVVLHEAGHYKFRHSLTELAAGTILLVIGVKILQLIIAPILSIPISIILGVAFGILMIRLGRRNEYEADSFALKHMTNPKGMISATNKFKDFYKESHTLGNNKIFRFLFLRSNPYENRIKMAEGRLREEDLKTRIT